MYVQKVNLKKKEQYEDTLKKLDSIGDIYDEMDINTKKKLAIQLYLSKLKVNSK